MTGDPITRNETPIVVRTLLMLVGAVAVLAGLYGRCKGIGTWPLGVDEFYISRSIDNVLRSGLPAFSCGGYYTRGLIFQYVVASLRWLGWSPEFAGRLVAGISSLAVLPAAYLLGRRLDGPLAGWLAVIILCVSIWEIEMARFARMYAPFQAVFAWYVVNYLRYTVDKHAPALRSMILLSVLGVLTWEGGALLGLASIFAVFLAHDRGRLKREDWQRVAALSVLLALFYLATRDLRGFAEPPAAESGGVEEQTARLHFAAAWFAPLWQHPSWTCGLLLPLALVLPASRWIGAFRERRLACGGLCLALLAAGVHLFAVAAVILVLMLLLRLADWRELSWRHARYFWLALGAFLLFWLVCEALFAALAGDATFKASAATTFQYLFGYPDIYEGILRPWGRTLPILSLGTGAAIAYLCWNSIIAERRVSDAVPALLSLIIVMALAVGAIPTDRIETRYTFFLYPPLIVLAVCAILMIVRRQKVLRNAPILFTAAVPLLCFSATEDFQPMHILEVNSGEINYRVGMSAIRVAHYSPRNEMRGAAQWLAAQVQPGDVVITGIPNLDEYYRHIDYFFLDAGDDRYETYVCRDGVTERWTNHPVLYTMDALKPVVAQGRRVFATLYAIDEKHLESYAPTVGWTVTRVWTGDYTRADVLLIMQQSRAARVQ